MADDRERVAYVTAAAAIYHALEIPLSFLPGGRKDGYKPESVLVRVSIAVQEADALTNLFDP